MKTKVDRYYDKAGQAVKVDDYIIYGHALGRSAALRWGKVKEIFYKGRNDHQGVENYSIRVRGVDYDDCPNLWEPRVSRKDVTLQFADRTILATAFVPSHIKKLLDVEK